MSTRPLTQLILHMNPAPASVHESRAVLKELKKLGDIDMFKVLRHNATTQLPTPLAHVIYKSTIYAQALLNSSPLEITIPPPPSSTTRHNPTITLTAKPTEFDHAGYVRLAAAQYFITGQAKTKRRESPNMHTARQTGVPMPLESPRKPDIVEEAETYAEGILLSGWEAEGVVMGYGNEIRNVITMGFAGSTEDNSVGKRLWGLRQRILKAKIGDFKGLGVVEREGNEVERGIRKAMQHQEEGKLGSDGLTMLKRSLQSIKQASGVDVTVEDSDHVAEKDVELEWKRGQGTGEEDAMGELAP
ncbi:hypothetical protein RUND412_009199 [Rhizina undulata]